MQRIQLVGHLEQNVAVVLLSSCFGQRCPSGITRGNLYGLQVFGFSIEPGRNVREEALPGHRFAEKSFQFAAQARAIESFRLILGNTANSALLDELTFESEKRRESVVSRFERLYFLANTEQRAQKIFDMRGEGDDKFRLFFGRSASG